MDRKTIKKILQSTNSYIVYNKSNTTHFKICTHISEFLVINNIYFPIAPLTEIHLTESHIHLWTKENGIALISYDEIINIYFL